MEKKLDRYLLIQDEEAEGLTAISLVSEGAIEVDWIALNKCSEIEEIELQTQEDKQVVVGAVMIPGQAIYRRDGDYEYEILFTKEVIESSVIKFFKERRTDKSTIQHKIPLNSNVIYQSWFIEEGDNKAERLGFKNLPIGTWMIAMKIEDKEIWRKIKNKELNGFSLEGFFKHIKLQKQEKEQTREELINEIKAKLSELLKK